MPTPKAEEFPHRWLNPHGLGAVILGYYDTRWRLMYAGRTRNGFTPASGQQVFRLFQGLESPVCPFLNLPERTAGRWGQGLTAEKMRACPWLAPRLVGQFGFVEWAPDGRAVGCAARGQSATGCWRALIGDPFLAGLNRVDALGRLRIIVL